MTTVVLLGLNKQSEESFRSVRSVSRVSFNLKNTVEYIGLRFEVNATERWRAIIICALK
jgi:hypothetical protein